MNQTSPTNHVPLERCVCGHHYWAHVTGGCEVCTAQGHACSGYWAESECEQAINAALLRLQRAEAERKADHGNPA